LRWEDHYSRRAKKEHYPARSVYKLKEIQSKFKILKKKDAVLDLGCFPGSWLLYAADIVGRKGRVTGVDLVPVSINLPPHVRVFTGDICAMDDGLLQSLENGYNVVLSDVAPSTTGNKAADAARSFHLCRAALLIAQKALVKGGAFVCKIFQGEDAKPFSDWVKMCFIKQRNFKPQSSRKESREIYIIGLGKK
jgi:23S rRNA (uridine2552-2'-O)-methyltransferase